MNSVHVHGVLAEVHNGVHPCQGSTSTTLQAPEGVGAGERAEQRKSSQKVTHGCYRVMSCELI